MLKLYGDRGKAINEAPKLLKSASGTPKSPCSEICHSASEIRQMASEIMLTHNEIFANAKVIRHKHKKGDHRSPIVFGYCLLFCGQCRVPVPTRGCEIQTVPVLFEGFYCLRTVEDAGPYKRPLCKGGSQRSWVGDL